LDLRQKLEASVAFKADAGEISAVRRKDATNVFPLGKMRQRGIGELQAGGFVAFHDYRDGGQVSGVECKQRKQPAGTATSVRQPQPPNVHVRRRRLGWYPPDPVGSPKKNASG
jgi:hypothetical protein